MKKVRIGNRLIGEGEPCFIIAEAGSNHNRDFKQALKLIDIAAESGADAVKFQKFKAETLASKKEAKKMFEVLKSYELDSDWLLELSRYAEELGLIFLCTPFDEEDVDLLDELNISAFKIASGDLTHLPFLEYVAKKKKPIILSTGGANLKEIEEALEVIKSQDNQDIILMHCVSNYPSLYKEANVKVIKTLERSFNLLVGYSDHSIGFLIPILAVSIGAHAIEKHFTINRSLKGPDHHFALEPEEFKDMVKYIRNLGEALGNGEKIVSKEEKESIYFGRRSIFACKDIPKGAIITKEMIKIVRPSKGIFPKYLDQVIGRRAKVDILDDEAITWEKIS